MPITDIIKNAKPPLQERVAAYELDDLNGRFDDLRNALKRVKKYLKQNEQETPTAITQFFKEATEVERVIKTAICSLGRKDERKFLEESIDKYDKALDGVPFIGKFLRQWKQIYGGKVRNFSFYLIFLNFQLRKRIRSEVESIGNFKNRRQRRELKHIYIYIYNYIVHMLK